MGKKLTTDLVSVKSDTNSAGEAKSTADLFRD